MIVVWRVTQHCNLDCPFCGYDGRLSWPRRAADPDPLMRIGSILAEYQRATGDRVLVSWMGGEPLLWPPLTELTIRFHRDLGLRVSATTNGTTLEESAVREHVLAHYAELTISVDGVGEVHDELRGWPGGYALLRESVTALAKAKRAAGHGPRLRVNTVLMRGNLDGFEPLCLELADWGIEEITFNQLGGHDRPEFFAAHRLRPAQVDRFATRLPELRQRLSRLGVQLDGGTDYLRRLRATARGERIPIVDCRPAERFLFISELGRVAPCSFTTRDCGVPLAEIASLTAWLQLPARFTGARQNRLPTACEDCQSTQVFAKFAVEP